MVENRKKHRQNSHLITHFPTSEGVSEVSGASERANGRASGPVLQSVFLAVIDHSASACFPAFYDGFVNVSIHSLARSPIQYIVNLDFYHAIDTNLFLYATIVRYK